MAQAKAKAITATDEGIAVTVPFDADAAAVHAWGNSAPQVFDMTLTHEQARDDLEGLAYGIGNLRATLAALACGDGDVPPAAVALAAEYAALMERAAWTLLDMR